jgi:hypothetical protein
LVEGTHSPLASALCGQLSPLWSVSGSPWSEYSPLHTTLLLRPSYSLWKFGSDCLTLQLTFAWPLSFAVFVSGFELVCSSEYGHNLQGGPYLNRHEFCVPHLGAPFRRQTIGPFKLGVCSRFCACG